MVGKAEARAEGRLIGRRSLLTGALLAAATAAGARAQSGPNAAASLAGQHPAAYYKRAMELFGTGQKDHAVFVFYLGQLRYRTHLRARPSLKPDGDPALFTSLSEVVGRPINEYAFGDMTALDATLAAVLAYDRAAPDTFTAPAFAPDAHRQTREGMEAFRRQLLVQANDIRKQRAGNGLENRR